MCSIGLADISRRYRCSSKKHIGLGEMLQIDRSLQRVVKPSTTPPIQVHSFHHNANIDSILSRSHSQLLITDCNLQLFIASLLRLFVQQTRDCCHRAFYLTSRQLRMSIVGFYTLDAIGVCVWARGLVRYEERMGSNPRFAGKLGACLSLSELAGLQWDCQGLNQALRMHCALAMELTSTWIGVVRGGPIGCAVGCCLKMNIPRVWCLKF